MAWSLINHNDIFNNPLCEAAIYPYNIFQIGKEETSCYSS